MQSSGVMPMPPASSRLKGEATRGKWLRGALMVRVSPAFTRSCMATEPPREAGSRSTAMR